MKGEDKEKSFYKQAIKSTVSFLNSFIESGSTESDNGNIRATGLKRQSMRKTHSASSLKVKKPEKLSNTGNKSIYKSGKTSKSVKNAMKKEVNKASSNVMLKNTKNKKDTVKSTSQQEKKKKITRKKKSSKI